MASQIHTVVLLAAAAGLALAAGAARAADYVVIPLEASVNAPAATAWKKIGGFCDIGAWLKTSCVITVGQADDVGAVRRIADRVDEVLVSRTAWSYTYAQPKSPIDYHGTVEVRADGPKASKILYTLVYDAGALPAGQDKAADKDRRAKMFTGVLQTMKGIAEAK